MADNKRTWFLLGREKPDAEIEDTTPTLKYFFKLLWRKAAKLLSLNLMMVFQIIPIVVAVLVYFFGATTPTVEHAVYAPLLGTFIASGSPAAGTLLGVFGQQLNVPVMTTGRMIVIICMIVITLLTWGWQNVGAAYNLRSMVRGDSTFIWSDYFYAVRRNLRQGFLFGLLSAARESCAQQMIGTPRSFAMIFRFLEISPTSCARLSMLRPLCISCR